MSEPRTRTKYSYDSAGNVLYDNVHHYFYDAENHILQVDGTLGTCTSPTTACYAYDADGNRVEKITTTGSGGDPAGTWQFLYDQSGRMTQRYDGTLWQGNIFVGSRHLVEDGGGTNFSHSDWVGTERVRVDDQTGAVCESIASLPFGDGQTTTGACYHSSPLHFTGQFLDSETNLHYFGARHHGPGFGRFMSPDPNGAGAAIRAPQSWNAYSYVLNNPINATDPTGLWCVWEDGTHDEDPSDGGWDETGCAGQGGHWDPTDTITGMDEAGNMMQEIQVEGVLTDDDRLHMVAAGVDTLTSTSSLSELTATEYSWALGAEALWELPGMIRGGWKGIASWRMASKMAGVRAAGEAGEAVAGIVKNTERIPSLTGTATFRIPDILNKTDKIIGEVKNYSGTVSLTEQIKDDVAYARANGYTMELHVSQSTQLSQPLRLLVNDGTIKLVPFP